MIKRTRRRHNEALCPDLHLSIASAIEELEAICRYFDRLKISRDEDFLEALAEAARDEMHHAAAFLAEASEYMPPFRKALIKELRKQQLEREAKEMRDVDFPLREDWTKSVRRKVREAGPRQRLAQEVSLRRKKRWD